MDFDGDGNPDLLSGSYAPGDLYLFRGEGKGRFKSGEIIKDKDGKPVRVGYASTVFAYDWRGTGKLDLLCGCIEGFVWLVPNEGTRAKPAYGKPVKLEAGGSPIQVGHGDSHAIAADWDGTGTPGLVVGCGDGSVLWYKNVGSKAEPKLAAARMLVPAPTQADFNDKTPPKETRPGMRAKVWVCDFNGDGRPDLLVGDFAMTYGEAPKLTDKDKAEQKELQAKLEKLRKEMRPYQEELQKVYEETQKITDPVQKEKERTQGYQKVVERHKKPIEEQSKLHQALRKFERPYHFHGHVWLYLRQPATATSAR
ncbi:MAG: VCBS repeat-containing protein [Planctomycetes bacterium]|nr:VCBS repeat-containing protein [Planctomycetota bacterium]